jgi:hypothetical protein
MFRSFAALVVCTLFLPSAGSAPRPKLPPGPEYFPTQLGTTWVYEQDGDESVRTVSAVATTGGETIATLTVTGRGEWVERVAVTPAGVFRRALAGSEFEPSLCLLQLPAKVGAAWDAVEPVRPGALAHGGRMTVGEEETVTVPAGTFKTVPVRWEITTWDGEELEDPETYTYWYAPGVGLIQFRAGTTVRQLKAFTPGRDSK